MTVCETAQRFAPIIEPFCTGPKTEVALINTVQTYCYEDTRIMKAFPQILKVRRRGPQTQSTCGKCRSFTGLVQQGLRVRSGDHLLAPEGLEAARSPALPQGHGGPGEGIIILPPRQRDCISSLFLTLY